MDADLGVLAAAGVARRLRAERRDHVSGRPGDRARPSAGRSAIGSRGRAGPAISTGLPWSSPSCWLPASPTGRISGRRTRSSARWFAASPATSTRASKSLSVQRFGILTASPSRAATFTSAPKIAYGHWPFHRAWPRRSRRFEAGERDATALATTVRSCLENGETGRGLRCRGRGGHLFGGRNRSPHKPNRTGC